MRPRPRAVVLAGRGRYEDPWHDLAATSHRVATILGDAGIETRVRGTFPDVALLSGAELLVVNAGSGRPDPGFDGDDAAWAPFHDAVAAFAAAGGAILGLHQAANTFADSPHWRRLLGGAWVDGASWHPPLGEATFVAAGDHPVTEGLGPVVATDERYADLVLEPGATVLLTHREGDADHPVAWVGGAGRVVYDALGHDVRSYDSPSRVDLLVREARWLLAGDPG